MSELTQNMLATIEAELQRQIARLDEPRTVAFHEMLTYHMGWTGESAGPEATGKRIRPLMLLLATAACGAEWLHAIPAAAAVELVHNFSLVHDDIQDNSDKRRGRPGEQHAARDTGQRRDYHHHRYDELPFHCLHLLCLPTSTFSLTRQQ